MASSIRRQRKHLAAKRAAIAKAAGLTKSPKKAKCDKKPKLMVESINMVVMRHGTTVTN
jgi:hypothetical protein